MPFMDKIKSVFKADPERRAPVSEVLHRSASKSDRTYNQTNSIERVSTQHAIDKQNWHAAAQEHARAKQ